jgi:hypothetical protein
MKSLYLLIIIYIGLYLSGCTTTRTCHPTDSQHTKQTEIAFNTPKTINTTEVTLSQAKVTNSAEVTSSQAKVTNSAEVTSSQAKVTNSAEMTSSPVKPSPDEMALNQAKTINLKEKNPLTVAMYTHRQKPSDPYKILGTETISKFNYNGIKRQIAIIHDAMRNLAAKMGGDAIINIAHDDKTVTGTVITYQDKRKTDS